MRTRRHCRPHIPARRTATVLLSALLLSACAVATPMTDQEAAVRDSVNVDQYMPASRQMRENIETQDLFSQAAFWSHEYDLNPADLEASIKLAAAVRKLGNPNRAVEITQTSRAIHPRNPYLLAELAAALIADERALDAMPVIDDALRVAPGYARLWSLRGAAFDQAERYNEARQSYNRALQITPNDPNVLANMGLSYALAGDPRSAEGWLRRAASLPGASAGVRQNLALVLRLQGKNEEADQQTRLSRLSRGDRKLPPPPVPAFTPRGAAPNQAYTNPSQPQYPPQTGGYQNQRSLPPGTFSGTYQGMPPARVMTQNPNGQPFQSASEAARAARGMSQQGAPQPSYQGGQASPYGANMPAPQSQAPYQAPPQASPYNAPPPGPAPQQRQAPPSYEAQSPMAAPMASRGPARSRDRSNRSVPSQAAPQSKLDQIAQSIGPRSATPPPSGNAPHVVGPPLRSAPPPPANTPSSQTGGYPDLAGGQRRAPARERR